MFLLAKASPHKHPSSPFRAPGIFIGVPKYAITPAAKITVLLISDYNSRFQDSRPDSTNSTAMLSRDFDSFFVLEASGKCIIGTLTLF